MIVLDIYIYILYIDSTLQLHGAIVSVLKDPGFKVPSSLAEAARETATALTLYCDNPQSPPDLFSKLSRKITSDLSSCFVSRRTLKLKKEAMWGNYHQLRSSAQFCSDWLGFVQEAAYFTSTLHMKYSSV